MIEAEEPSKPGKPAWKSCKICSKSISLRALPLGVPAGDDLSHLEELSLTELEEKDMIGLGRCPHCRTFYLKEGEYDSGHWYSYEIYVDPIADEEALQWLNKLNSDKAKDWLGDLRGKMGK